MFGYKKTLTATLRAGLVVSVTIALLYVPVVPVANAAVAVQGVQPAIMMALGIGISLLISLVIINGKQNKFANNRIAHRPPAEFRADWRDRLPRFMQPFLTWLMGYPYPGQKPSFPLKHWTLAVGFWGSVCVLGIASTFCLLNVAGFALVALPVSMLLTVSGARALQVHICHQGIHKNLSGNPRIDRIVVEVISTVIVVQNFDGYEHDHDGIHHPRLASDEDPDLKFILGVMNLKPWLTKQANRKRFFKALISPKIHALFLAGRLRANFVTSPLYRRLMSLGWLLLVVAAVLASGMWLEFIVGCVLPMTGLYAMSAMAQFYTEHFWVEKRKAGQSAKQHFTSLLVNRHLGDPLPPSDAPAIYWFALWIMWWARLFLYHLPIRLGVLPANLPVHGGHHLWPLDKGWTNSVFTFRRLAEETGTTPREIAGSFGFVLDTMLEAFSESSPPPADQGPAMTTVEAMKIVVGM